MAEIINLRLARKASARTAREQAAAENRAKFGEALPQRKARKADEHRASRLLDGARLDAD